MGEWYWRNCCITAKESVGNDWESVGEFRRSKCMGVAFINIILLLIRRYRFKHPAINLKIQNPLQLPNPSPFQPLNLVNKHPLEHIYKITNPHILHPQKYRLDIPINLKIQKIFINISLDKKKMWKIEIKIKMV